MESQPQNPEFRNNPENFHPCKSNLKKNHISQPKHMLWELKTCLNEMVLLSTENKC